MKYSYQVKGMTCTGCETRIKSLLLQIPIVKQVEIKREADEVIIDSSSKISEDSVQDILGGKDSKYQVIKEIPIGVEHEEKQKSNIALENNMSWLSTYKPVLLIFLYLFITTIGYQWMQEQPDIMEWMRHFMAGFFLIFSFFKLLNIKGFAYSYAMYDLIASRFKWWGFVYPFLELMIGLLFLFNIQTQFTNWFTFLLMSISIIGVISSVVKKRKIKCACLGDVFNLPMSTVTIIEDALMIVMSFIMIWMS